jgi:NitT/TauT family transport system substrate-binding protein
MRRTALAAVLVLLAVAAGQSPARALDQVAVTEPNHVVGYLPLYLAQRKGFFAEEGLEVKWTTIENGSGPTNAILAGRVFGVLGGPEHNAYAKVKGADLKAIGGVITRASIYVMAGKGQEPASPPATAAEWASYMKGKKIGVGAYGSTPNSAFRYLLTRWGLDPKRDVELVEVPSAAILAAIKAGQAQIGVVNEPLVTQGIRNGIWGEPIYNVPRELGPYAWATLNVRADTLTKEPKLVERFMRAMVKGLKAIHADPAAAVAVAKLEFPTMSEQDLTAAIDRTLKDDVWSKDGSVDEAAWTTAQTVVLDAGILKKSVPYNDLFDMKFIKRDGADR